MNSIKDWFNSSRNYSIGVALYNTHGSDDNLKEMFAQGHSEFRARRLEAELRCLKDTSHIVVPAAEPTPIVVAVREEVMPENKTQPEADPYRDQWIPLYAKMNFLRHNLVKAETDEERGEMAHEILDLEQQCMVYWHKRDYFLKYQEHLPEGKETSVTTNRNELHRKLTNIRTYISKAMQKLKDKPDSTKIAGRIARYREEAKRIEFLLEQLPINAN